MRGLPPVDVRVDIRSEHARDAARFLTAALATLKMTGEWLGPYPGATLELLEPGRLAAPSSSAAIIQPVPWLTLPQSMTIELATARAVSGQYWHRRLDGEKLPAWFVSGLVELTARRAVEPLFQVDNLEPGYAFLEARFFGGFVPKFLRIRLTPETDGEPLRAYRANAGAAPAANPATADLARALEAKTILTLGTLDRWVGRPVFDEILAEFVRDSAGRQPSLADFTRVASNVSGQNLSWLFDETLASSARFDYALGQLSSEAGKDGVFLTTVAVQRNGAARFPGASAPPVGPFESGRGITLQVDFADGQRRTDHWDGRGQTRVFTYRSPARALSAAVDPDGTSCST